MNCPLYGGGAGAEKLADGNVGLYYEKFLDTWSADWLLGSSKEEEKQKSSPKLEWIRKVAGPQGDAALLKEYRERMARLVWARGGVVLAFETSGRFVTGLGRSHPIENGFAWHPTLGAPYLPASSIKGLIGCKERESVLGQLGRAGRVILLDAVPAAPVPLAADVMTPHYLPWDAKNPPADWRSPMPIPFLTVGQGATFLFGVLPRMPQDRGQVAEVGAWIGEALQELGAGAKTAVGYGRMAPTSPPWLDQFQRAEESQRLAQREQARRNALDPRERELQELAAGIKDPQMRHWKVWLRELNAGRWPDAAHAAWVADRIRADLERDGRWKPQSKHKNLAKDRDHQDTLSVMKHVAAEQHARGGKK